MDQKKPKNLGFTLKLTGLHTLSILQKRYFLFQQCKYTNKILKINRGEKNRKYPVFRLFEISENIDANNFTCLRCWQNDMQKYNKNVNDHTLKNIMEHFIDKPV